MAPRSVICKSKDNSRDKTVRQDCASEQSLVEVAGDWFSKFCTESQLNFSRVIVKTRELPGDFSETRQVVVPR